MSISTGIVDLRARRRLQHIQSAQARQADVEDGQVVDAEGEGMVGLLAGGDDVDRMGGLHQRARQRIRQHPVVLDEQYPH